MTALTAGKPAALFDAPAAGRPITRGALRAADGARNFGQGACASLLTFAGATQLAVGAAPTLDITAFSSADLLVRSLVEGDFMGWPQILGGAALFLAAGRGFARVAGLLTFVAVVFAYFQGVEASDFAGLVDEAQRRLILAREILFTGAQNAFAG